MTHATSTVSARPWWSKNSKDLVPWSLRRILIRCACRFYEPSFRLLTGCTPSSESRNVVAAHDCRIHFPQSTDTHSSLEFKMSDSARVSRATGTFWDKLKRRRKSDGTRALYTVPDGLIALIGPQGLKVISERVHTYVTKRNSISGHLMRSRDWLALPPVFVPTLPAHDMFVASGETRVC